MISDLTLKATPREGVGKGPTRRLRAQGLIPAAVYGEGKEAVTIAINAKELATILRSETGHNTIFNIDLPGANGDGETATVIVKDWQVDPVKGRLLHADLMRLSMTTITHVNVHIEVIGEPTGVRLEGGILELQLREVPVECLPGDIPDALQLDVSEMSIGDHATIADLVYDRDKIKLMLDEHQIIAGVLAPRMAEEAAPTAADAGETAGGEPEVIKKGKTEE